MLLVLALYLTGCYTSRPVFSKGDPVRISTKLRQKDVSKPIRVFMKDGSVIEGKLFDFDATRLVVLESGAAQPQELLAARIEKIELKERNYALAAIVMFVGLLYAAHELFSGLNEAFQGMGH
ncbi:MAG: hypothetical protein KDI38_21715 [Calditrichaeota bacterium]|nr:hypothetical protein [Calditrichota bacterium]